MLLHGGQRLLFFLLLIEKSEIRATLLTFEKLWENLRIYPFLVLELAIELL